MTDHYDDYSRDQLLRLLRERDRRPRFGLVWERDEIDHDLSVNNDFVALDPESRWGWTSAAGRTSLDSRRL